MADLILTINARAAPIEIGEIGLCVPGPKGRDGDGYTPVRGVDYWTDADVATMEGHIENYISAVILGGAS